MWWLFALACLITQTSRAAIGLPLWWSVLVDLCVYGSLVSGRTVVRRLHAALLMASLPPQSERDEVRR